MVIESLEIGFLTKIFYWVYARPLWQIVLFMVLAIVIWAILGARLSKFGAWRIFNIVIAAVVVFVILYLTILRRSPAEGSAATFVPTFNLDKVFTRQGIFESFCLNILLFFPLGLCLPFAMPVKAKNKALLTLACCMVISFIIEFSQGAFALGDFEIADLIANVAGAAFGSLGHAIIKIYHIIHIDFSNKNQK